MEFYTIPPVSELQLMHKGDRYFCLAQLYLKSEDYRKFFLNLPKDAWITLDNGAGDHDLVTEDVLFDVMKELRPSEVIPPDIIFNGLQTIQNARIFYERMVKDNLQDIEIFFCPQGKAQEEWLDCYKWAIKQDWISTIGFSKIGVPFAFLGTLNDVGIMEGRHNAFNYLKVHDLFRKPIHMLGMGNPLEYKYYKQFEEYKWIRSSDSCNSIWSAINGYEWNLGEFDRIKTPKTYFEEIMLSSDIAIAEDNISFLKSTVR